MVLLTTTPQILSAISLLPPDSPLRSSSNSTSSDSSTPRDEESLPLPTSLNSPISHQTLISLSRALLSTHNQPSSGSEYTLNTLLRHTRPYTAPPPPAPEPTPEYLILKRHLLAEQEEREYNTLLNANNPKPSSLLPPNSPDEDDDISPQLILNILLSILLCSFAVFYASQHLHLTPRWEAGVRVLLALGSGIVVGVAEVSVYAAYLRKVGDSRRRERERRMGRKERKVVVGREEVGRGARGGGRKGSGDVKEKEGEDGNGDVEEIEIWGRGVNGGVRRRVRERWEKDREKELELEVEKKEKGVEEAK